MQRAEQRAINERAAAEAEARSNMAGSATDFWLMLPFIWTIDSYSCSTIQVSIVITSYSIHYTKLYDDAATPRAR